MPGKRLLIFLLVTVQLLTACNGDEPVAARHGLPVPEKKSDNPKYGFVRQALKTLHADPMFRNATLGYMILDVTKRDPVVVAEENAKKLMQPASTLKIFVTGAALEILGPPVVPEVTITNLMSVNWRSSKLLRRIGGKVFNEATTGAGVKAILDFWSTRGVDTTGMVFYDGNGLSHSNAISPKQLVDALYAMRTSPWYMTFYESLPLAGLTGTLHRAMKGTAAEGRIHAKTGTIGKVKSFAGYVTTVSGHKLVFSLLVNDYDGRVRQVKKKLEEVLVRMAEI